MTKHEAEQIKGLAERLYNEQRKKIHTDPYLQPGWPCELKLIASPKKWVGYWDGEAFCRYHDLTHNEEHRWKLGHHHYRPIGTEWDFAPEWAVSVYSTDIPGNTCWIYRAGEEDTVDIKTVLPAEYYGQTIQRPIWAK